jgi:fucose 4-O-acetylase-like acetyltransferase
MRGRNMPEAAKRDYYFDNLKFVLILLVVIGHALEPLYGTSLSANTVYHFIYFFHIPLFVFVTGYFTKKMDKISHLLALYIIFQVLYTLMDFYVHDRSDLSIRFSLPYWVTWYLMAVILWKLVLPFFIRLRYPIITSSVLAVLAGYAHKDLGYIFSSLRAFNFFPFFIAGYYMKREYLDYLFKKPVQIASVLIIMVTFFLLFRYGHYLKSEWLWGSYTYQEMGITEWYAGLYRIAVASVTVVLSTAILSLTPVGKTWFSEWGTRTIYPFLLHGFLIKYVLAQGIYGHVHTGVDQVWLVLSAVIVTILLSTKWVAKYSRWLFHPQISFLFKKKEGRTRHIQT